MSLSERLADGIVDIIRDQRRSPGDALPSSRELARRFDVTTPTVREALRRLEAIGVVEFRHGSGTYVGTGLDRRVLANPHRPASDRESVLELIDARLVLEPAIAAAAARTRDPAAMTRLAAVQAAPSPLAAADFHVALAAASGNRLLAESMAALLHVPVREQFEIHHRYDDRERDHARILAAIGDGDERAAERLARDHLRAIRKAVRSGGAQARG